MMSQEVTWRHGGHQLQLLEGVGILRFEVADLNAVIKSSARASEHYDSLLATGGLPAGEQVLPLSCFAITDSWTPQRLAQGTRYTSYRSGRAAALTAAGFALWPTEIYVDGDADPRNEVHYDAIVAHGPDLGLAALFQGTPAERGEARDRVRPHFARLLSLLSQPLLL